MEKTVPELMAAISPEDWALVPGSVLALIEELVGRMDKLEQSMTALQTENELLKEQLGRTSTNSSQPSSKNPLTFKPNRKEPTGKKRGRVNAPKWGMLRSIKTRIANSIVLIN
jgi:hypothetical protein